MLNLTWRKLLLFILLLVFLTATSGCQVARSIETTAHTLSKLPDRLSQAFFNIMGGMKDVGGALADQIGNIVGNMTGK